MSNSNYTLKTPVKHHLVRVDSTEGTRIFTLRVMKPTYGEFWFTVGQFIQGSKIKSVEYIGTQLTTDHWGRNIETIYASSKKAFPQVLIEDFNAE